MQFAKVLTVSVFARPGTPSSKICPFVNKPVKSPSTRYLWPTTTRPISCCNGAIHWLACRTCVVSSSVLDIGERVETRRAWFCSSDDAGQMTVVEQLFDCRDHFARAHRFHASEINGAFAEKTGTAFDVVAHNPM